LMWNRKSPRRCKPSRALRDLFLSDSYRFFR